MGSTSHLFTGVSPESSIQISTPCVFVIVNSFCPYPKVNSVPSVKDANVSSFPFLISIGPEVVKVAPNPLKR